MITKGQLLASLKAETEIIKHLASKVTPEMLDYRPTEPQRSLLELMQYMTRMAIVPAIQTVTGNWDHAADMEAETESVSPENFAAQMDVQYSRLAELFDEIDDRAAETSAATMPWGAPTTVGAGMMDMALKCMVAYRMQLFLYIKASGVFDIGPPNCWAGVDLPVQG